MSRQEWNVFWVGLSGLSFFVILAEGIAAPPGIGQVLVIAGCVAVIGYTFYRFNRRRRRRSNHE